jgi:hypothetical protein
MSRRRLVQKLHRPLPTRRSFCDHQPPFASCPLTPRVSISRQACVCPPDVLSPFILPNLEFLLHCLDFSFRLILDLVMGGLARIPALISISNFYFWRFSIFYYWRCSHGRLRTTRSLIWYHLLYYLCDILSFLISQVISWNIIEYCI